VTGLTQPLNGVTVLNSNGTVNYTPKSGFTGTDSFTYKATDGLSQSNTATVTVTVAGSIPVAGNDSATTNKITPVVIAVLANDSDPGGSTLTVTNITAPA